MQFTNTLFALAAAMAVSGEAVFKVTNFAASCPPHGSSCGYSFDVVHANAGENVPVHCSKILTSSGGLPSVTDGTCENSGRTWTVKSSPKGGFVLTLSQQVTPSSDESASHAAPASDITIKQEGASSSTTYTGPANFDLV